MCSTLAKKTYGNYKYLQKAYEIFRKCHAPNSCHIFWKRFQFIEYLVFKDFRDNCSIRSKDFSKYQASEQHTLNFINSLFYSVVYFVPVCIDRNSAALGCLASKKGNSHLLRCPCTFFSRSRSKNT